jgi:hypothetical protein
MDMLHACEKYCGCDSTLYLRGRLRTGAKGRARRGRTAGRKRRSRSSWPAGASGSSRTALAWSFRGWRKRGAGHALELPSATCRAECNEGEVLIVAILRSAQERSDFR